MSELLLIDNQDVTRIGLKSIALSLNLFTSIVEADDKDKLIYFLNDNNAGVVAMDYTLMDISEEYLLILPIRYPKAHFIMFCDALSTKFIRQILFSTTSFSIIMKDSSLKEIEECLKMVSVGKRYVCYSVDTQIKLDDKKEKEDIVSPLTITEREILKLIAMGKTTKDIANERFLSVYTVMTHRKNIFRKLSVNNIHEATKYALRAGLVDPLEYYI